MIIRRTIALLATVTVAVGLSLAAAGPAAAKPMQETPVTTLTVEGCLANYPLWWEKESVGSNKTMASCYAETNTINWTFTAVTKVISTSFWTGFHGCVKLQFIDSFTNAVVYTSPQRRWGVSADHSRTIQWTDALPTAGIFWDRINFVHWRC